MRKTVAGRLIPATWRRLKPSHSEELTVGHIALAPSMSLAEARHGEPAQDGCSRLDLHLVGARAFSAMDCPGIRIDRETVRPRRSGHPSERQASHAPKQTPAPIGTGVSGGLALRAEVCYAWGCGPDRLRKPSSLRARTGCWSLRIALASTWRTRSRVTLKMRPTSSSVYVYPSPMP